VSGLRYSFANDSNSRASTRRSPDSHFDAIHLSGLLRLGGDRRGKHSSQASDEGATIHPTDLLPDFAPLRMRGSGQLRGPGFLVHYEGESAAVAITR